MKKLVIYTAIYVIMTLIMSYDEVDCALKGEELCLYSLIGKYVIFIILVLLFNNFIRPKLFSYERKS